MNLKSCSIRVIGRVQGVYYRQSTLKKAIELDIRGFVKNEDDGGVYIEASGDSTSMDEFIQWCKKGPIAARVDEIEVKECLAVDESKFEIRH